MKMFYIGVLSYFGIPPEQFTQVCKHVVPRSLSSNAIHNNLLTLTGPLLVDNSLILITYCQLVHISLHLYTGLQILNSYRKIPKMSPGAYIFQRPFLRGLFFEGLIYGGKSIGLALYLEVNLPFLLCFTLYLRAIFRVQVPGLIFGGAI